MSITFPSYTVAGQKTGAASRTRRERRSLGGSLVRLLIAPNTALIDDTSAATIEETTVASTRLERPRAQREYLADIW